jgi:endonuclease/exonuclease/phosphatase family metal-dependent hydrolase
LAKRRVANTPRPWRLFVTFRPRRLWMRLLATAPKIATVRVLTWNLFHGRAVPPAGRPLLAEYAATIAGWEWDLALLQEVPPWWPPILAKAAGAEQRTALTSRNSWLPLRRAIASRAPDLLKADGGGANAILARVPIRGHRCVELTRRPERRVAHGVRLGDGSWVANLHATLRPKEQTEADIERAADAWGDAERLILGGDFNLRSVDAPGLEHLGGHWLDHVLARGWRAEATEVLDAGALSDHRPVRVVLGPNQAVSASGSPGSPSSPTQAT